MIVRVDDALNEPLADPDGRPGRAASNRDRSGWECPACERLDAPGREARVGREHEIRRVFAGTPDRVGGTGRLRLLGVAELDAEPAAVSEQSPHLLAEMAGP